MKALVIVVLVVACSSREERIPEKWTAAEYEKLASEAEAKCRPRNQSRKLQSAVAVENLPPLDEIRARGGMDRLIELTDALRRSLRAYERCGAFVEVVQVETLLLEAFARVVTVAKEQVDLSDPVRQGGLEKMRTGIAAMTQGLALVMADLDPRFSTPLAPRVGHAFTAIRPHFPEQVDAALRWIDARISELDADNPRRAVLETVRDHATSGSSSP